MTEELAELRDANKLGDCQAQILLVTSMDFTGVAEVPKRQTETGTKYMCALAESGKGFYKVGPLSCVEAGIEAVTGELQSQGVRQP